MSCNHEEHVSWLRKVAIVEFGMQKCPNCGHYLRFPSVQIAFANLLVIFGFAVSAALSIMMHRWEPYLLLFGCYTIGRTLIVVKSKLLEAEKPSGLSAIWFVLLAMFIWLLMKYF